MKSYAQSKIRSSLLIVVASLGVTLFYQNCGKLSITDLEAQSKAAEAERIAIGKDDETVVVGVNAVPDLKMFFVVDNSGTMTANAINLAASFGSMFDASSSDSLSKFDTTAVLISTAQKSPSFTNEKSLLDGITARQQTFSTNMVVPLATYSSSLRTDTLNSGVLAGDNIGYQVSGSSTPTSVSYSFLPAPVLGAVLNNGQVSFNPVIRKLASENSSALETDFKARLGVLSSNRIPLELVNGTWKPVFASVVDTESGLCSIARILRNPESTIKSGDLLSFTVVSDENDNDPEGYNCIQKVSKYTGADVVDGYCRQRETTINYQTSTPGKNPDSCTLTGLQGYNFRLSYPQVNQFTDITYRTLAAAPTYSATYSNIKYKWQGTNYSYLNTNISYKYEKHTQVISDGNVIGDKVTIEFGAPASKSGNFVAADLCATWAKQLNANAITTGANAPVCTSEYKYISTCSASDPNCKATPYTEDRTSADIAGTLNASECLSNAQAIPGFLAGSTPTCPSKSVNVSSCSSIPASAACYTKTNAVYGTNTISPSGTKTAAECLTIAKAQYGNAVVDSSHVTACNPRSTTTTANYNSSLKFSETAAADGGATLANNADCGVINTLAIQKGMAANSNIPATASCTILNSYGASNKSEAVTSDCASQAVTRCSTEGLRSCVGTLVVGSSFSTPNPVATDVRSREELSCNSKCSDSKLGACGSDTSNITIAQFLINKYGAGTVCTTSIADVAGTNGAVVTLPVGSKDAYCQPTVTKIPTYLAVTKNTYRTDITDVEYVTGSVTDAVTGLQRPAKNLVDYIKARSQELSNGSAIFAAIVRQPGEDLGTKGGTYGTDYNKLIDQTGGQKGSVISSDYSVALKDLGKVIKSNIQRTLVLKKMRQTQVIKKVFRVVATTNQLELVDSSLWSQNGASLVFTSGIELNDGDQFKVEYQNY